MGRRNCHHRQNQEINRDPRLELTIGSRGVKSSKPRVGHSFPSRLQVMSKDHRADISDSASIREATPTSAVAHGHGGSLRSKLVLSLAAMFFLFLTIDEMVRQKVIRPAFLSMERNGAIRDNNRVLAALNAEVRHLHEIAIERTATLKRVRLNTAGDGDANGNAISHAPDTFWSAMIHHDGIGEWLRPTDSESDPRHPKNSPEDENQFLQSMAMLCKGSQDSYTGMTRFGPHVIVMFALVRIDSSSPQLESSQDPSPFFLLARPIDADMISVLKRQTQVDFLLDASAQPSTTRTLEVWESDRSTFVEVRLTDPFDRELATLLTDVPREITRRSNQTSAMARQSFILGASAALLLLLLLLQRIVIGPLAAIREYSERVAAEGLEAEPLIIPRNDEIGELARAFHRMMQRLGAAQLRLASASRAAGMSQVADTVIHNVGNVLTNVNSLLESATNCVTKLRIEPLGKLADRLQEVQDDTTLTKAVPDYLHGLASSLEQDRRDLSELLTTLNVNIRHIHDVIRDQRRHATTTTARDRIKLGELVQEAIRCCQARLERDNVAVDASDSIDEIVDSDRSMLLQILINIIGNARQALRETDNDRRSLVIRSNRKFDPSQSNDIVELTFADTGCGMSEATLANIFEAHFTTRDHGTGLGLHFCAITLKRLGGSIRAESEGPGRGSTFILELPIDDSLRSIPAPVIIPQESTPGVLS